MILSTLFSGLAIALTTSGKPVINLSIDRGLVVLLVGFGLHIHRLRFGIALLEDDLGFGFTLRANRRRWPSASAIRRCFSASASVSIR